MKFSVLLAAATPAVQATVMYMAAVPDELMSKAEATGCNLPDDFQVQNFTAQSEDSKTPDSFDFTFNDDTTILNTECHFNSSSVPIIIAGRTPRYACDNALVEFIWQNGTITMIEKVCAGDDGVADFQVSGTALVPLVCDGVAARRSSPRRTRRAVGCKSDSDDIRAKFFSLNPVPS